MSAPRKTSPMIKRSLIIDKAHTSTSLETPFWDALNEIAAARQMSALHLIRDIRRDHPGQNFSSTLRLYVLKHYVDKARKQKLG